MVRESVLFSAGKSCTSVHRYVHALRRGVDVDPEDQGHGKDEKKREMNVCVNSGQSLLDLDLFRTVNRE